MRWGDVSGMRDLHKYKGGGHLLGRPHRNLHAATCSTGSNPFLKHALVGNPVSVAVYGDRDKPDFVAYLDLV
ncbi:hypothetical protein KSS87_016390 [Heliosperma pusillum]|nr:hypothetical protein KSS87_000304 [Heliosperma pusillum]KAH9625618.1 hypothetical protein KSS87_016390 [Heliosperma pusillum]